MLAGTEILCIMQDAIEKDEKTFLSKLLRDTLFSQDAQYTALSAIEGIQFFSQDLLFHFLFGLISYQFGNYEGAEITLAGCLPQVKNLPPDCSEDAKRRYEALLRECYYWLAMVYAERHAFKKAVSACDSAIEFGERSKRIYRLRGAANMSIGCPDEADNDFRTAKKLAS